MTGSCIGPAQLKKRNRNPNRTIGEPKTHIRYQNRKTASIFYENWKPDAKQQKSANRNEHHNRKTKVFWHKNRKTDLKNSQNRKT